MDRRGDSARSYFLAVNIFVVVNFDHSLIGPIQAGQSSRLKGFDPCLPRPFNHDCALSLGMYDDLATPRQLSLQRLLKTHRRNSSLTRYTPGAVNTVLTKVYGS
jgi:hypothetical protein